MAAAEARQALLELASERLNLPVSELTVADGVVSGGASKIAYADLVGNKTFSRRVSKKASTKRHTDYKIVGKPAQRIDIPDKVTGHFSYVQDIRLPGMVHGRVVRPPSIGATLIKVTGFSRSRPEVKIVAKKDFLAVVAPSEWEAIEAAADLRAQWSSGTGLAPHSDLGATLRAMPSVDVVTRSNGNIEEGFQIAARTLNATYLWPFQAHGSIGPSCAVADVRADGTATVWSATQDVHMQREAVARLLNIRPPTFASSMSKALAYGHNGSDDANGDVALLSQEVGRPVRVQWMRHDEHGWAPRGAPLLVDLRAGLSAQGTVTAWDFQSWALTRQRAYRHYGKRVSGYLLASQLSGGRRRPAVAEAGRIINAGATSGTNPTYSFPHARTLIYGLPTRSRIRCGRRNSARLRRSPRCSPSSCLSTSGGRRRTGSAAVSSCSPQGHPLDSGIAGGRPNSGVAVHVGRRTRSRPSSAVRSGRGIAHALTARTLRPSRTWMWMCVRGNVVVRWLVSLTTGDDHQS